MVVKKTREGCGGGGGVYIDAHHDRQHDTMDDIERSDYFIKYHKIRISEDEANSFSQVNAKWNVLQLNHHSSVSLDSTATTSLLYVDGLKSYASLVDSRNKGKINNYADQAVNLLSHSSNEPKQWKSALQQQRGKVNAIISTLKCQDCSDWKEPKQLSTLFARPFDDWGRIPSPPRVRKTSEKSLSSLKELPKLALSEDVRSPESSFSAPLPPRLEGQGYNLKSDQSVGQSDSLSTVNTLGKSGFATPPVQFFGRSNFNSIKDIGSVWNNKAADSLGDYLPDVKRELTTNGNNYDNVCSGYGPPGRKLDRNGRGGRFGQCASRDYEVKGARQSADDYYNSAQESSVAGMSSMAANFFKTARDELVDQNAKKNNGGGRGQGGVHPNYDNGSAGAGGGRGGNLQFGAQKRSLGTSRRGGGVFNKFVPPVRPEGEEPNNRLADRNIGLGENGEVDERLKNIDPKMIELIKNEIMDISAPVCWDDIAGLEFAKTTIQEIVVWPMLRPDIFTGLRKPPKGLLLFGPPGTGKTLIGKCIASQSNSTFFSISASSLTSKWIGDGEKMVRALFAVAKCHQPAVVFIDEIDSLLSQRSDTEHESSRRIKTEFLVQLDGAGTGDEERILVVGATNRPQELDEAARRRLVKRLYIPLPEFEARRQIIDRLMSSERNDLTPDEIDEIAKLTDGYSGADMKNVCQEASLGPIRSLSFSDMHQIRAEQVRPVNSQDFKTALHRVRASVSQKDLQQYVTWDQTYGMSGGGF